MEAMMNELSKEEAFDIFRDGLERAVFSTNPKEFAVSISATLAALAAQGAIPDGDAVRATYFLSSLCRANGLGWLDEDEETDEC